MELRSTKLYRDLVHPKKTWATTASVFTKRGLPASDLCTKKVKCACSHVLITAHFFYRFPVSSWECGWVIPIRLQHFWTPPEQRDHKSAPDTGCTANLVHLGDGPVGLGGRRGDVSIPADGEPVSRWGFAICRGTWHWLGVQGCSVLYNTEVKNKWLSEGEVSLPWSPPTE